METLLRDRTTSQPRSVHSGRGSKSIAHDGGEAKASVTAQGCAGLDVPLASQGSCSFPQLFTPTLALPRLRGRGAYVPVACGLI
jgi:hypothetical protein